MIMNNGSGFRGVLWCTRYHASTLEVEAEGTGKQGQLWIQHKFHSGQSEIQELSETGGGGVVECPQPLQ